MANDKRKGGRVTPRKGEPSPGPRRSALPRRIGPFERPDPDRPVGQVGKRPSSPVKLFVFFVAYFACGIIALLTFKSSLRIILGVVFIGISLFWLRGASAAVLRQQQHRREGR